mmetsp:Transcript_82834/g.210836  ORF Transcript_82834/g.210836 Transcript_82834/m.210836 type:complete len:278 (-) Transcript_82834:97-930(-)
MAAAGGDSDLTETIMEYQRREFALLSNMAQREREMKSLRQQANEAVDAFEDMQKDSLRGAFVDPVVNIEVAMLRQQLREKDENIKKLKEEAQNSQFQPNSIQGQKLLRKCAHLLDENSELGRQLGEERMQVLRIQLTAERTRRAQLKRRAGEFDRRAEQIDAENEAMNQKITELGQQLKTVRAEIDQNKKDIEEWRSGGATKRKRSDEEKQARAAEKAAKAATGGAGILEQPALPTAAEPAPGAASPTAVLAPALAAAPAGGEKDKKKKKKKYREKA